MNSDWLARREEWRQQPEDARDEASVDYARIIHSASFRRLQGKTQVLTLGEGDFYRTRLTHSIEVAQIAEGIARQFQKDHAEHSAQPWIPNLTMIQAVGATHDLGHPPFGHGGEVALNYCMRENGGFEGNGQTLRILTRLERFSAKAGSMLMQPWSRPATRGRPRLERTVGRETRWRCRSKCCSASHASRARDEAGWPKSCVAADGAGVRFTTPEAGFLHDLLKLPRLVFRIQIVVGIENSVTV
jgi:hypothetical protein